MTSSHDDERPESIDAPRTDPAPSSTLKRLGERVKPNDRYEDRGEIARGGMGSIRRVWDDDLRRTLAMKVVLARTDAEGSKTPVDERVLARFLEEAQVTAQLDHPGVVPVHELGLNDEGQVFFTMRLVRGRDLSEIFEQVRKGEDGWTVTRAVGALLKVCEAMAYAHSKRVIHRDLKPANIMVGRFGEVYVMDWGLARVLGKDDPRDLRLVHEPAAPSLVMTDLRDVRETGVNDPDSASPLVTMDGDIVGTPSYMSPEQARGDLAAVGPASDVYSLGAILYHLLAEQMPFVGKGEKASASLVWTRLKDGPPTPVRELVPSTPEELVAICEKAMARESQDRYVDTLDMAEDLRAYLEGRVVRAHSTGAIVEFRKWVARNKALAGTAAGALVLTLGSLSWSVWTTRRANRELEGTNSSLNQANDDLAGANNDLRDKEMELMVKQSEVDLALAESQIARVEAEKQAYAASIAAAALQVAENNGEEMQRQLEACPRPLRGWEWRHLSLSHAASLADFDVQGGGAWGAAFVRGGAEVVAVGPHGTVSTHNVADGAVVSLLKAHMSAAVSLAVSADGQYLATGARDGSLLLLNKGSGLSPTKLEGHRYEVRALAFTPDGRLLSGEGFSVPTVLASVATSTTSPNDCNVYVWDCATGERLETLSGHTGPVNDIAVTSDGKRACSVSNDRTAHIWELDTGELLRVSTTTFTAQAVAFNPLSDQVAFGGTTAVVTLQPLAGGEALTLRGHGEAGAFGAGGAITDLAYSPDGQRVASASEDGTVRVWDATTGASISTLHGHRAEVDSVAFSPDGALLVTAGRSDGIRVWDSRTANPVNELSPTDRRLSRAQFQSSNPTARATTWWYDDLPDAPGGLALLDNVAAYCEATDLLITPGRKSRRKREHTIDLWDAVSAAHIINLPGHTDSITDFAITRDGARAASASKDRTVRIWSVAGQETERTLSGFKSGTESVAFHPLGEQLAIGASDGRVYIYDIALTSMRELASRHEGAVTCVVWDAAGEHVATAGIDDTIRLWRASDGALLHVLQGHRGDINDIVFHPEGGRLFSAARDRSVRVWSTESGEALLSFTDFRGAVVKLALARDGRRLVAAESLGLNARVSVFDSDFSDLQEMWHSREVHRVAQVLVERLARQHESLESVIEAIVSKDGLDPEVRAVAEALARAMSE